MTRWPDAGGTNIHVDSGARGCRARGGAVRYMGSAVHEAFSRGHLASLVPADLYGVLETTF